jgi:hypothetical protein
MAAPLFSQCAAVIIDNGSGEGLDFAHKLVRG